MASFQIHSLFPPWSLVIEPWSFFWSLVLGHLAFTTKNSGRSRAPLSARSGLKTHSRVRRGRADRPAAGWSCWSRLNFPAVAFGAEGYGICSRLLATVGQ